MTVEVINKSNIPVNAIPYPIDKDLLIPTNFMRNPDVVNAAISEKAAVRLLV